MKRKGLTLMELLTVISIIATLSALLYPVYQRVMKRVYATSCAVQIRQIGVAFKMYAQDYGRDDPYVITYADKLYPHYVQNEQVFVCPYFQRLAPEVVEEMHRFNRNRWGRPWSSYDTAKPVGRDDLARKYPDKIISFAEIYAVLRDRVPIAWCPVHRVGCPSFLGPSPKGRQFCLQNCTDPTVLAVTPPHLRELLFGVAPHQPPGPLSDLSQPFVVLRWDGSVSFKFGGGWSFAEEVEFLEAIKNQRNHSP